MNDGIKRSMLILQIAGLFMLAFLAVGIPLAAADSAAEDASHSYCVKMGYLYRSSPGINGGQGICEFPDKTWCDAQAYYTGRCGPSLSPNFVSIPYSTQGISASTLCSNAGGWLESVHTPYGDVTVCTFPNGRTCDIQSLYNGMCGGDNWFRYANSWLNAP